MHAPTPASCPSEENSDLDIPNPLLPSLRQYILHTRNDFALKENFSEGPGVAPNTVSLAVMGDVIEHSSGQLKNVRD